MDRTGQRWGRTLLRALAATFVVACASAPAAVAAYRAPDPGGREAAVVQVPPPGKFFGYHEPNVLGDAHGWQPRDVARLAKRGGANTLRFTIDWLLVEPVRDVWSQANWARYERVYEALQAKGIRPLITIAIAPKWARDTTLAAQLCEGIRGCEYPPRPAMLGEWAEFAAEVARRFPNAAGIEIWNEPNLTSFYKPRPEPARYAALVISAYDAIKAVNPKMKVIGGALAPTQTTERDSLGLNIRLRAAEFLKLTYEADPRLRKRMDGISFHHSAQHRKYGKDTLLGAVFRDVRKIKRRYKDNDAKLWVSEFGLSTTGATGVRPKVQADALARAYRRIITMRDVKALVFHTLADRIELPPTDREYGFGAIASFSPFVPKPAYCAFAGRMKRGGHPACRPIREWRVSGCTRRLTRLTRAIERSAGAKRRRLERRHARLTKRCVPCVRRIESLQARVARGSGASTASALRAAKRRCTPCGNRLLALQRRHARAPAVLKLDILKRHDSLRRDCRP